MIVFPQGHLVQSFDFVDNSSTWVAVSNLGEVRFGSLSNLQAPYGVLQTHQFGNGQFFDITLLHEANKYLIGEGNPAHLIFIDKVGLMKVLRLALPK